MKDFSGLELATPILEAVHRAGYSAPTPVQARTIPPLLQGRDVMGIAQTGTGKTAAFALPMLHRLGETGGRARPGHPRALVLAPTRELACQIGESFRIYGRSLRLRTTEIFGGASARNQIRRLRDGVDIVVATPGRLLDLMEQGHVHLDAVEILVLDEADRMLDMGFMPDIRRITQRIPADRQTAFFSATMAREIRRLADGLLDDPVHVEVAQESTTVERILQTVLFVDRRSKQTLLHRILDDEDVERVIIFTRTKHCANRVTQKLAAAGIAAEAIHGNKSQNARQRALKRFRDGRLRALVATDIAARGIDVPHVSHVINFELPDEPQSYVHRIGRTARAGREGIAISLCDMEDRAALHDIERIIRRALPVDDGHEHHDEEIAKARGVRRKPGGGGGRGRGRNFRKGGGKGTSRRGGSRPARRRARAGA